MPDFSYTFRFSDLPTEREIAETMRTIGVALNKLGGLMLESGRYTAANAILGNTLSTASFAENTANALNAQSAIAQPQLIPPGPLGPRRM